jgi:hypothetical protein
MTQPIAPATPPNADQTARFLSLSEEAHTALSRTRATVMPIGGKQPESVQPTRAHMALSSAFDAFGKLHTAGVIAPDERAGSWMHRAVDTAGTAVAELQRATKGVKHDTRLAYDQIEQALSEISIGRRLVTSPPSDNVYDGS